ncbi:MAG: GAF domain-containing protein [Myxococcales bacterium]|nr:GAF domain-containing protein [Myxococcales bacterium]
MELGHDKWMASGMQRPFEWKAISTARSDASSAASQWMARQVEELSAAVLRRLAESSVPGIDLVLEDLLAELGRSLDADRVSIYSVTDDRRGLRVLRTWAAPGVPRLPLARIQDDVPELVERVLRGERIWVERVEELRDEMPLDHEALERLGQRSLLALPLRLGGSVVGGLSLGGVVRSRRWSREVVDALESLGHAVALALGRRQWARQIERRDEDLVETERLAGVGHWTHHYASGSTTGSQNLYRILGLDPRAEIDLVRTIEQIHPEDRATYESFLTVLLVGGEPEAVEVRAQPRRGDLRFLRCWGEAGRDQDGTLTFARGVVHDITERKQDEQAMIALNHRLVKAHEQERARLAREIHDDLGQRLAALKLHLDLLRQDPAVDSAVAERLTTLSSSTAEVAAAVRGLSHALHPGVLERLGLRGALEALCAQQGSASGMPVQLRPAATGEPPLRSSEAALGLYRVAQEALANAIRHGRAPRVELALELRHDQVRLSVRDEGVGMVLRGGTGAYGLGLLGMRERMHLVGGTLQIDSTPGRGTTVEATVPWPEPEAGA